MYICENVLQKIQSAKPFVVLRAVLKLMEFFQMILYIKICLLFIFTLCPSCHYFYRHG